MLCVCVRMNVMCIISCTLYVSFLLLCHSSCVYVFLITPQNCNTSTAMQRYIYNNTIGIIQLVFQQEFVRVIGSGIIAHAQITMALWHMARSASDRPAGPKTLNTGFR